MQKLNSPPPALCPCSLPLPIFFSKKQCEKKERGERGRGFGVWAKFLRENYKRGEIHPVTHSDRVNNWRPSVYCFSQRRAAIPFSEIRRRNTYAPGLRS